MPAHNRNLAICVDMGKDIPINDRILSIKDAGFDGVFTDWQNDKSYIKNLAKFIRDNGLFYQSVHASFSKIDKMWERSELAYNKLNELKRCVEDCSDNEIDLMISHVWVGFEEEHPNEIGVENFAKLIEYAKPLGVRIALENTEGESYLKRLTDELYYMDNVGFCIDTGHEMCYNKSEDLIHRYGENGKLFCTHLNDNMGITTEKIFWHDDAHLMPFDGIADWGNVARRLNEVCYNDTLTFELTSVSKPNRDTHKIYEDLDYKGFFKSAYEKAVKFAALCEEN